MSTLEEINRRLGSARGRRHFLAPLAVELLSLVEARKEDEEEALGSIQTLIESVMAYGAERFVEEHLAYARDIAESEVDLEYEEMHKLFSLCEEIEALEVIGIRAPEDLRKGVYAEIGKRLSAQASMAKLVADDKGEIWKDGMWIYQQVAGLPH